MRKPSVTDWIQATAVVLALALAFYELVLAEDLSAREQRKRAADMIAKGTNETILESAEALLRYYKEPFNPNVGAMDVLFDLTPFSEYLLEWSICYDHGICDAELSLKYACRSVPMYEEAAQNIFSKYEIPYDSLDRPLIKSALWSDCINGNSQ